MRDEKLGGGSVELVNSLGDDYHLWDMAGVSRGRACGVEGWDGSAESMGRVKSLLKMFFEKKHWTPFEMGVVQFAVRCPIYVARQWMRYRSWVFIERSGRYVNPTCAGEVDDFELTLPEGRSNALKAELTAKAVEAARMCGEAYRDLVGNGVPKEQARKFLPQGGMTEFNCSCNVRALMHFLGQRLAPSAQGEMRKYAKAVFDEASRVFPVTLGIFAERNLINEQ